MHIVHSLGGGGGGGRGLFSIRLYPENASLEPQFSQSIAKTQMCKHSRTAAQEALEMFTHTSAMTWQDFCIRLCFPLELQDYSDIW